MPKEPTDTSQANIHLPESFKIRAQDRRLEQKVTSTTAVVAPPLGVLSNFTGNFAGAGFNTIFRPNSGAPTTTTFPNPVNPAPPTPPSENVLELNLTTETLSFSASLGSVPNRGLESQNDIFLNGVPYVQVINDVSNPDTGRADGKPSGIHFEPGLWMHVPATTADPVLGESLVRMASIPHGTTINAQCLAPTTSVAGAPTIPPADITPFIIGAPTNKIKFAAQTASATDTPRLPQDLSKFIAAGTITQDILNDPNTVLRNANQGKTILNTTTFTVSTTPTAPELGGGTANIAFLQGAPSSGSGPNASAVQMSATFWINTVQHRLTIPAATKPGLQPVNMQPAAPNKTAKVPTFAVQVPKEITAAKTIKVNSVEIQYSQTVLLNFAGLRWPHVSCATLVQSQAVPVPPEAWK